MSTVTTSPARLVTADELIELEADGQSYELSRGMLVCVTPTHYIPGYIAARVNMQVCAFVGAQNLGICGSAEMGFRLASAPDTVRAPDLWFVRTERLPARNLPVSFFPGPPDLAIEVLSLSDRYTSVVAKIRDYLDAGTPLLWVLDARSRTTAVFRPGQAVQFLDETDTLDGEDVLPGFRLPIADLYP